jgi:hypothetical protein
VGHFAEHAFFLEVHGGFRRSDGAGGARFYFDETEDVVFPRDQIEIAACVCGAPAARGYGESQAAEVEEGCALAATAGGEVRGLPPASGGCAIQAFEKILKHAKAEFFEPGHFG